MKTSFYIDGFNFYYGVFRRRNPIAVPPTSGSTGDLWLLSSSMKAMVSTRFTISPLQSNDAMKTPNRVFGRKPTFVLSDGYLEFSFITAYSSDDLSTENWFFRGPIPLAFPKEES